MKAAPFLLVLAACELHDEPDVGSLQPIDDVDAGAGRVGACADSDPSTAVSFALHIRPLTTRSPGGCVTCHGPAATSGLNMSSFEALFRGGINSGARIVVPGSPCESILVTKLGLAPPFGARMPYNGPPYFTAEELTAVRDWIAEGAHNN